MLRHYFLQWTLASKSLTACMIFACMKHDLPDFPRYEVHVHVCTACMYIYVWFQPSSVRTSSMYMYVCMY